LKRLTIPRLELSGAVLLTKLVRHIIIIYDFPGISIYLWTDSAITYTWVNNHPSRWKEFVHNRVCFIQETLPQAIWCFVPGKENPADLATRGLMLAQLIDTFTWWIQGHTGSLNILRHGQINHVYQRQMTIWKKDQLKYPLLKE